MSYFKTIIPIAIASSLFSLALTVQAKQTAVMTSFAANPLESTGKTEHVGVSISTTKNSSLRTFSMTSTQQQRDDKEKSRVIVESEQYPQVHTSSLLFDALFSLAMDDAKLDSVKAIRDFNYNKGESIACECFETGEKWNYVWTRDLAYAVNLGLVHVDPERAVNSLLYKVSGFRHGVTAPENIPAGSLQIVQDTGSGGSWPVSTDRVTWAVAARSALQNLSGAERSSFLNAAYAALQGTLEADRVAAFDESTGLYGGEQSYLDWRTQTYAPWIVNNLSRMAESKALSTNVLHFNALQLAAELAAEKKDKKLAEKYQRWANELKQKINEVFWLKDADLYATMAGNAEDPAAIYKFDMLGNSLAIIYGVASETQAQKVMQNYPHTPMGVPVYYPQQPNIFVYHNRSMWPFVTAYSLKAAVKVGNYQAADNAINSLVRGAALNLSNMENLEWLTGKPYYDDGPEINSRRQLWSVGAYAGMAIETIFGVNYESGGITIQPFLTPNIVNLLGDGKQATLKNLLFKKHKLSITLALPAASNKDGIYKIASVALNNKPVNGVITEAQLSEDNNVIEVSFGELATPKVALTLAPNVNPLSHTDAAVFSPEAPIDVAITQLDNGFKIDFKNTKGQQAEKLRYNIYKNGVLVAGDIKTTSWTDSNAVEADVRTCFTVESEYMDSGHKSHHSEPRCVDGSAAQLINVTDKRVVSNLKPQLAGEHFSQAVLVNWGAKNDTLHINDIQFKAPGTYAIYVVYNNRQHTIDSGVTNAVKALRLLDKKGVVVKEGVVQMPNVSDIGNRYPLSTSTEFRVVVKKGQYQLLFNDYFNMSYLETNSTYRPTGGVDGPVNSASIAAIKIVRLQ